MITINLDKAKTIAHSIRRTKREQEFAPYDALIAKQIPGTDAAAAEQSRIEIRQRYADIQQAIDASSSPDEIKQALALD
jgi:hypothetical protein